MSSPSDNKRIERLEQQVADLRAFAIRSTIAQMQIINALLGSNDLIGGTDSYVTDPNVRARLSESFNALDALWDRVFEVTASEVAGDDVDGQTLG